MNVSSLIPPFDFQDHVVGLWASPDIAVGTAWTIAAACLVAIACGLLGCFLIVQGLALIGDAISHTVLLGIVVAFLLTGQFSGPAMFVGAAVTGILTAVLIEFIHRHSRVKQDAAIGIVFSSLFALGVILLSTMATHAHIDADCVLFGKLDTISFDKMAVAGFMIPVSVVQLLIVTAAVMLMIVLFYKELLAAAFDPQLAAVLGLRPRVVQYGLMGMLSLTVVSSFTAVGAILVVAMMIAPPATAYLLTKRLPVMLLLSALFGVTSAVLGTHLAFWLDASTAGAMVCVACGLFTLSFLFSPSQGLIAGSYRRHQMKGSAEEPQFAP
ncbi:Manganese transport system membrane protein MntB [Symmachiella macrocystis]|uniref:Manganese transport system membrane protein MntB n=1 Tax=Symmachiella macrocystis TaxID=2527985 RepID=A0A5C6BL39_9PLAN|nr:metal ABC transporter permease [Symmachiella macrocystis]TWU12367.1 Manganese transport system membrane protein MntB [Symmachiella macrocystis]